MTTLALQRLPLEHAGPDLDQLAVAVETLVQALLLGDVHAHARRRRVNVCPDDRAKVLKDELERGGSARHVALVLGEQEVGDGRQEVEAEVQVPDRGTQDDNGEKVHYHCRVVVVHRLVST